MNRVANSINTFPFKGSDEIEQFLKKRVILDVILITKPFFEFIVAIWALFVSFICKDSRIVKIRRSRILSIENERKEANLMARQTALPDTRVYPSEILHAMNQVLEAQRDLSDRIFELESLLEGAMED